jgi:hypothetical protein
MSVAGIWIGALVAVSILSLLKRFDHFGNRSAPLYYFQRWQYTRSNRPVHLPLILPPDAGGLQFQTWEGDELFSIEAEA